MDSVRCATVLSTDGISRTIHVSRFLLDDHSQVAGFLPLPESALGEIEGEDQWPFITSPKRSSMSLRRARENPLLLHHLGSDDVEPDDLSQ
jgi:hypothetical protein